MPKKYNNPDEIMENAFYRAVDIEKAARKRGISPEAIKRILEKVDKQITLSDDVPGKIRPDRRPPTNNVEELLRWADSMNISYQDKMSPDAAKKAKKKMIHGTR